ncbi:MAG: YdcF family protein, partial [Acetobacteraceae bacterium]|nr:YdcF family protein [Acetobacteraceae bacterium]
MVTFIILLFLVAGCCCAPLSRRKLTATLMAAALVSFEAVGSGVVPSLLVESLQARFVMEDHPAWGERNAIIVLGRGTVRWPGQPFVGPTVLAYSRIVEAVRLYGLAKRNQRPCRILISGGDASSTGVTEAAAYGAAMLQLGVEPADIVAEGRSLNTFQNAEFTAALLRGQSFDKLFLVTSGLHLRRALLYFGHFGVHPLACAADRVVAHPS